MFFLFFVCFIDLKGKKNTTLSVLRSGFKLLAARSNYNENVSVVCLILLGFLEKKVFFFFSPQSNCGTETYGRGLGPQENKTIKIDFSFFLFKFPI